MKLISVLIIALVMISTSCRKGSPLPEIPIKTNQNLTYFGYTLVDVGWDDPTDQSDQTNYVDEVAPFSNLADILIIIPDDYIVPRLNLMAQNQLKAVLHLHELFFEQTGTSTDKSGVIYGLRADYKTRWDTFSSTNDLANNFALIGAFYIGEEPAWNGISADDFTKACDYIKATIPMVPLFTVEAYPSVKEMYIPSSIDWVGFDHYFLADPETNSDFQNEMAIMKSKMQAHQRIVLILDAHFIKIAHGSSGIGKNDLDVIARAYYNMANADTNVVGILGYHWPNGFEFKSALGTRGLPEHVRAEHQKIGKTITGK